MEIVYDISLVPFSQLNIGDLYRINTLSNNDIYMKIAEIKYSNLSYIDCVNLTLGRAECCSLKGTLVIPLKGRLVIE